MFLRTLFLSVFGQRHTFFPSLVSFPRSTHKMPDPSRTTISVILTLAKSVNYRSADNILFACAVLGHVACQCYHSFQNHRSATLKGRGGRRRQPGGHINACRFASNPAQQPLLPFEPPILLCCHLLLPIRPIHFITTQHQPQLPSTPQSPGTIFIRVHVPGISLYRSLFGSRVCAPRRRYSQRDASIAGA